MKKVFQRIVNPNNGDCMKAAIASLLDDEYDNVPNFIEHKNIEEVFDKYLDSKCYSCVNHLHNWKWQLLLNPTSECYSEQKFCSDLILNPLNLTNGVDGYFYCAVLSPGYFSWDKMETHAVICDKNLNIVHDPNEAYKGIRSYPLASIIDYNGIIGLYDIRKKKINVQIRT